MNAEIIANNSIEQNTGLLNLNRFMLEQTEINAYDRLVDSIVAQLDILLKPVTTAYSEYDDQNKVLRTISIKANQKVINLVKNIVGEKIFLPVTPVNDDLYKEMLDGRLEIVSSLHEATQGAVPEHVSILIGKALGIKCYLGISFVIDGRVYGTAVVVLKEQPEQHFLDILKTYAHFTSISLRRVLAEQALRASERELKTVTENMTDMVSMTDIEGKISYVSGSYYKLLGYKKDELLGKSVFEVVFKEDLPEVLEKFKKAIATGQNDSADYRAVKKDGTIIWLETSGSLLFDSSGLITGAIFSLRDITDRKRIEEALRKSEQKYRQITENISDVVWITDLELNTTYISSSIEKLVGESAHDHLNRRLEEKFPPESVNKILTVYQEEMEKENDPLHDKNRTRIIEVECFRVDGTTVWVSMHISALRDNAGTITGLQGVARDITERKKAEDYIRYISFHDQLTGLYNRHYFEYCRAELESIPVISVIVTDINSLKLVNDTYGHDCGDKLIKEYAEILKKSFKRSDLIFRWGGDEFIVILKNTEEANSWELFRRLEKHCGKTFVKDIPLSISAGISSKVQGENIEKALSEAENMMYINKINESKNSKKLIINTILQALSGLSHETRGHTERMSLTCHQFGKYLNLSSSELSRLDTLTMLHDIGLINIDSAILLKESPLTGEEWDEIKKHPGVGYHITRSSEDFASVAEEILAHHERWDGSGYPRGLKGENIPYLARILNLVDSYEVMLNGRPHKNKISAAEIIEEVESCSGKQFDPGLAKDFVAFLKESCTATGV